MKYALALSARAKADIASAKKWYESQRLGLADLFREELQLSLDRLRDFPYRGAPYGRNLRRFRLLPFPYFVYYRISGQTIEVRACLHQHRKPFSGRHRYFRETLPPWWLIDSAPREAKIGSMTREAILVEFRKLPLDERIELMEQLWEEFDPAPFPDWLQEQIDRGHEDTPNKGANLSLEDDRKNLGMPPK